MRTFHTFADLGSAFLPRQVEVADDGCRIGHFIDHGGRQATAFDEAGRPLGVFASAEAAISAIRAAARGAPA